VVSVHGESADPLDRLVRRDLTDSVDYEVELVQLVTPALPDCLDQTAPLDQLELSELEDWSVKLEFQAALGLQDFRDREVDWNVLLISCCC